VIRINSKNGSLAGSARETDGKKGGAMGEITAKTVTAMKTTL
jgi:hypothetical protein